MTGYGFRSSQWQCYRSRQHRGRLSSRSSTTRLAPVLLHTPPGVLGLLGLHAVPSATREPQGLPSAELVRPLNHYLSARFLSNAGALRLSQAALVLVLGLDGGSFARSLRDMT